MKRYIKNAAVLLLMALASLGCTETKNSTKEEDKGDPFDKIKDPGRYPPIGSQLPHPRIQFMPGDLSTFENGSLLRVIVSDNSEAVINNSILEDIQKAIRLTDALSSEVSFQTLVRPQEVLGNHVRGHVQLVLDEPLKEGWHTLSLTHLPEGLSEATFPSHMRSDDGGRFVRFRVGTSWLILWGIRVCMGESGSKVIIDMTERMIMRGSIEDSVKITASGHELACENTTEPGRGESGDGSKPGGGSFNEISLNCAPLSAQDAVTIEISPDLVGMYGDALKGPRVYHFVVGELEDWGQDCKLYRGSVVE